MASSAQCIAYRIGSFVLDLERGTLLAGDGKEMPLRPKSFALLLFLVENAGRLLSRDAMMETLWPNVYVTEDNITQCIHDIRGALGAEAHQMLRTLPRRGYLFTSDIIAVPPASSINNDNGFDKRGGEKQQGPEDSGVLPRLSLASLPQLSAGAPKLPQTSVMVGSLRNLGVPEKHARLAESAIEDICTYLAQWKISLIGPAQFHIGESLGLSDVARGLGVAHLIQGSIRGASDQIEVNLQLVEVETGVHLWSERFVIDLGDTANVRNETSRRLAGVVVMKLSENARRRTEALPPKDWTPLDVVRRGYALLFRPIGAGRYREAIRTFEQALVDDPDLVEAKLGIAAAIVMDTGDQSHPLDMRDLGRAERLLLDLLRVDANIPHAHLLMGVLRREQGRLNDSKVEHEIALALSPNFPDATAQLGLTLACLGTPEAGIPLIERSLRLAPQELTAPLYHGCLGLCHLLVGHFEAALISLRTARALNPSMFYIHWWLAAALGLAGESDESRAALAQAIEMRPGIVSAPACYVITRRPSPAFIALFDRTVYVGLRLAGLPDILY